MIICMFIFYIFYCYNDIYSVQIMVYGLMQGYNNCINVG